MGLRRFIAGGMVAGALLLTAAGPASAASITYTPATISYGTHSTLKVTGLTPKATYGFQIYDPSGAPLIPGAVPFVADASGTFTSTDFDPQLNDPPGTYLFEVQSADGKVVARTNPVLVGTSTYFVQRRLGG